MKRPRAVRITDALVRRWVLPAPGSDGDKEERGRLLIVAGSRTVPGAAILAANAALRSGVGKVTVATEEPLSVGQVVPEARVVAFGPKRKTPVDLDASASFDAVLIGPGLEASQAIERCVRATLALGKGVTMVLDAGALTSAVAGRLRKRAVAGTPACVLTPHAGEMAALLGIPKQRVEAEADDIALKLARVLSAVIVLKGATTRVASDDRLWTYEGNNVALATSGSGDVLAGVLAGLAARGAAADQAAVWAVAAHALAGERLVRRHGRIGALAREIPDEIPRVIGALARKR